MEIRLEWGKTRKLVYETKYFQTFWYDDLQPFFTSLSDTHNLAVMNQTKYIIDIIHDNLDGPQSNSLPSSWNWRTEETWNSSLCNSLKLKLEMIKPFSSITSYYIRNIGMKKSPISMVWICIRTYGLAIWGI